MTTLDYLGIITQSEIQQLQQTTKSGERHPVATLALENPKGQVAINTEQAAKIITQKNSGWLSSLKPRLIDTTEISNASGALGELRAYGALLETWMTVSPEPIVQGKRVVPEFEVGAGDGLVIVEVHSRQLNSDQKVSATKHSKELTAKVEVAKKTNASKPIVVTDELEVIPFGAPDQTKPGDSVLTNVISRIASIKEDESQIDPNKPFVLWLDLQDPTVWGGLSIAEQQLAPLYTETKDGEVGTGALWFALYGRKGDPMIETECFSYRVRNMLHDGRFFQTTKTTGKPTRISAVVYSMPRATVLMENPSAALPLPPRFRASLLRAPFFLLDRSLCEWKPGLIKARVALDHEAIQSASNALSTFKYP